MKKLIITCATLAIVMTVGIGGDAFAKSKKRYYMSLLATDIKGGAWDWVPGDHTWTCIERYKKKSGKKWKWDYNRCYSRTGGTPTSNVKFLTRKKRIKSTSKKNGAKRVYELGNNRGSGGACSINLNGRRYGTCHQETNRMGYAINREVNGAWGYWVTHARYGKYGHEWSKCKRRAY